MLHPGRYWRGPQSLDTGQKRHVDTGQKRHVLKTFYTSCRHCREHALEMSSGSSTLTYCHYHEPALEMGSGVNNFKVSFTRWMGWMGWMGWGGGGRGRGGGGGDGVNVSGERGRG